MTIKDGDKWITALIGIFSGIGVKMLDRFTKKNNNWIEGEKIRNEQRVELDDLRAQLQESLVWCDKFYEKLEETIELKATIEELTLKLDIAHQELDKLKTPKSSN